ncbi:MAG: diacylglycerol kinase family protein [Chloroflexi bacterium]|nr:diacylglycerol kinase family protein [Chloroflexota bacterium]
MGDFFRGRLGSFRAAFEGWWHVWRTQPNAWIHAVFSLAVIAVGIWVQLDEISWALIVLAMTLVWIAEFANTAVEAMVDLAGTDHHPLAKVAKDVSAAAVLIAALAAVAIGILVLGLPLWERVVGLISSN